jgi:hypothetical protein
MLTWPRLICPILTATKDGRRPEPTDKPTLAQSSRDIYQHWPMSGRCHRTADGVAIVEAWDEPDYVSLKCRDPDGYVIEAAWEPHLQ